MRNKFRGNGIINRKSQQFEWIELKQQYINLKMQMKGFQNSNYRIISSSND